MKQSVAWFVLVVALLAPLGARAASDGFIDCDKAAAPDEKAICASNRLIQQDARMVTLFKVATSFVGMGVRGDVEDAQVKWLETRHSCKDDVACLKQAYEARIARLQKVIDGVAARGPF